MIFLKKYIPIIRQMDFRISLAKSGTQMLKTNFPFAFPANKMVLFGHSTTRNVPYVHLRLDSNCARLSRIREPQHNTSEVTSSSFFSKLN